MVCQKRQKFSDACEEALSRYAGALHHEPCATEELITRRYVTPSVMNALCRGFDFVQIVSYRYTERHA